MTDEQLKSAIDDELGWTPNAGTNLADVAVEGLLLIAVVSGDWPADDMHPLGYGRERFFWSLVAAVGIDLNRWPRSASAWARASRSCLRARAEAARGDRGVGVSSGDLAVVGGHGQDVRDHKDADAPGEG